ncbi:CDP-diacylglycerol--serine O-phosphatidyltransferase [Thiomicrospira microaerophila]|nr:CDP-diacylglycerol--serine O-phosphatidyltransferase [Thiomicrospira microaerophila]UQB43512.1 CDP-diacylglycerol--serine O-phosphatidyltransferase [Thiomicrospira microaerophila]
MTTLALFAGFYAVIAGMNGDFVAGAIAIFVAMVFDGLDGRIARMTNSSSAFGAEYDSLADMVSFGLAPALLLYQWILSDFGKLGWLIAFVFTAGAALRLARFNTQVGVADKRYFQGLPSPAAAAVLAGLVWMVEINQIDTGLEASFALFVTLATGLLMVSNIRYSSFKEFNLKDKVPFISLLLIVLIVVVVTLKPSVVLFTAAFLYAISGVVMTLFRLKQTQDQRKKAKAPVNSSEPSDNSNS